MATSISRLAVPLGLLLAASSMQFACESSKGSSERGPIVVADWVKEHKPAVDALRAQLDAASALIKDLPAASVHAADPVVPIRPFTSQWGEGTNMVILRGTAMRGLPEYGRDDGKSIEGGEQSISFGYTGHVDLASAFSMVDKGESLYTKTTAEGVGLAKKIAMIRYAIIGRELAYQPGSIDAIGRSFNGGSYKGVAHIVDLQGPALVGSVMVSAANSGTFESYEGSESYMLRADLEHAVMRAFHAELGKVFPEITMPAPPTKTEK